MTKARFYIYRNLTKKCFSIKHRGKVVGYADSILIKNPVFKVNEKGRQRVIKEKQKNVHAYVTCFESDMKVLEDTPLNTQEFSKEITYNPYYLDAFKYAEGNKALGHVESVLMHDGRIYTQ